MSSSPESPYEQRFLGQDEAESYALQEYGADSYSSSIWSMQRPWLKDCLSRIEETHPTGHHLDFACGTGRISQLTAEIFPQVDGLDISAAMVDRARATCPQVHFFTGNILEEQGLCPGPYTSITSFRLLLNLEPHLRVPILQQLHARLHPDGVLIVDMHGNRHSLRQPAILWKRWRHGKILPDGLMLNAMTREETVACLKAAGFQVELQHGTGLLPPTLYRWPFRFFRLGMDRWLSRIPLLQPFCIDLIFVCKKEQSSRP